MSKYIIDIPNGVEWGVVTCRTEDGFYTRDFDSLEELNSDYINEHFGELQDEAYQAGLNDAWEAARKIIRMPDGDILDLFPDCYASVCTAVQAILKYDASEAIAKLKAYEDKHSDRIEVGDEVATKTGKKYTVVAFGDTGNVCGFNADGKWTGWNPKEVTKTGKHYDIASILEAMRA